VSAGYIIYSLDWDKFRNLVDKPTPEQLSALAKLVESQLEEAGGEWSEGDPIAQWPGDAASLTAIVAHRLALPDWYGDLSDDGKHLWESVIFLGCMRCEDLDVGFDVENDGIYWDVIEIAWKRLGVKPYRVDGNAISTFGVRPFRYTQAPPKRSFLSALGLGGGDGWRAMHSMHPPDEVRRMKTELESVRSAMETTKIDDVLRQYEEDLMPALESVIEQGRMLFIQVDT